METDGYGLYFRVVSVANNQDKILKNTINHFHPLDFP